ncbi:MAG TPA: PaaI family thioesterase [Candidatus Dormibacteraeota bacterium]|nr:PaaI family thioesterase [Candidatus Dormibacteraeota bacterium]
MSRVSELAEEAMQREAGDARIFDLKVNYVSAGDAVDELKASSRIVHAGRRTIVAECRIEAADGRLIATASGTFAVTTDRGKEVATGSNAD